MNQLGQQVRRLREARHWTQVQLAVHAGVSPTVVNQIETGKRKPSIDTVEKLAEALGTEVADLFRGYEVPKSQAPLPFDEPQAERRILEDRRLISTLHPFVSILERDTERWRRAAESGSVTVGMVEEASDHQGDMARALNHLVEAADRERWSVAELRLLRQVVFLEAWSAWEQAGEDLLKSLIESYSSVANLANVRRRRAEAQEAVSATQEALDRVTSRAG